MPSRAHSPLAALVTSPCWGSLAQDTVLTQTSMVAWSLLQPLLGALLPCCTPRDWGQARQGAGGGHLLGQAPVRPSGWARTQQRCPRQRWAPRKAGCRLDSLWAGNRPRGENREGVGRPGWKDNGQDHKTREDVTSGWGWWGRVGTSRARPATRLPRPLSCHCQRDRQCVCCPSSAPTKTHLSKWPYSPHQAGFFWPPPQGDPAVEPPELPGAWAASGCPKGTCTPACPSQRLCLYQGVSGTEPRRPCWNSGSTMTSSWASTEPSLSLCVLSYQVTATRVLCELALHLPAGPALRRHPATPCLP